MSKDLKNENVTNAPEVANTPEIKEENGFMKVLKAIGRFFLKIFRTLGRWFRRMFMGASKELSKTDVFSVENIDSPGKQAVKAFFRKPLAVAALSLLVFVFGLCFIGSLALPLDYSYSDSMLRNISPGLNMMSVDRHIKKQIKEISSFSSYTVGLGQDGKVYTWGDTKLPLTIHDEDMSVLPNAIKNGNVAHIAAGFDHAIAITQDGHVVGWGEFDNAQYGDKGSLYGMRSQVIDMPADLQSGTIDVNDVKQLVCGYQVTAIVMNSGKVYAWGNKSSGANNLNGIKAKTDVSKVAFLGTQAAALSKTGELYLEGAKEMLGTIAKKDANGNLQYLNIIDDNYFAGRTIIDIAASNDSLAILADDGELLLTGKQINVENKNFVDIPKLPIDEKFVEIHAGARHFVAVSNKRNVYAFGENYLNQCDFEGKLGEDEKLIVTSFQNYVVNKTTNKLVDSWGFKGYFMGSDDQGRDVFARIINGGKMSLTIGAVSVIIAAIIGIIVGVVSGYFGGWVDMILMRVTEVFSAIPFLPFALILSAVMAGSNISEDTRIFIIMCILGLLSWTGLAHMVRGQILAEREKEFVLAAKAMGVKESKIAFKHILPNVMSIITVHLTLDFAGCLLTESSLSYLGFGVKLPRPTWGNMLDGCNNEIVIGSYWWRWLFPALFLLLSTISINLIGDALRDVLDPKSSAER
ncbi:MAG: ABC transporter permease subunit [Bacilli bacterium]|nr:ABC transporter permease subunit [Bacilli bacterium]